MKGGMVFDSYAYVKKLKATGVPEEQAEVHAEVITDLLDDRLATKRDLQEHENNMKRDLQEHENNMKRDLQEHENNTKRDMKELEVGLKRDMKELEMRLIIKLGALMALSIGVVATLVKLL